MCPVLSAATAVRPPPWRHRHRLLYYNSYCLPRTRYNSLRVPLWLFLCVFTTTFLLYHYVVLLFKMPSAKPFLHPLKTPKSATFPSELHDEILSSTSDTVKQEAGTSTPITPPTAYTDFLKAYTPVFTSPASAGVTFPRYPLDSNSSSGNSSNRLAPTSACTSSSTSQPASAVSGSFTFNEPIKSATAALPPPVPSAGTTRPARKDPSSLRRLRIPPSSAVFSPSTDSPRSATTIRSPYSPSDWKLRYLDPPRSATTGKPINVRQVVTRTVTYKRTQLEAPPKGKRRKYQESKQEAKHQETKDS